MVPIIASHRRRLQFLVVPLLSHLHKFFFQFPEQNLYWNIAPLRSARIFLSNESLFAQNWFRTRELCPFYPALQSALTNFRTRNVQFSCHISLYRSSNSLILDVLEREFDGASEYQLFASCTALNMFSNWWKQLLALELWRCWRIWFFFFDHEFMGTLCHACKTIQVHNLPPRWRSGVEKIANKSTIPNISNCGIASLAKLVSVRVC